MKTKFLFFVGLILSFSTFTAQSVSKPQSIKVATSDVLIGGFRVGGQTLEAWGDSSGNITALYLTDSSGNHTGGQSL